MTNLSVDTLARRGGDYAQEAAERFDRATDRLSHIFGSTLQTLERTLERTLDQTPDRARAALVELQARSREGHGYLREKPLAAMGAALALGIVAALLLGRTRTVERAVPARADTPPVAKKRVAKRPRAATVKPKTAAPRTRRPRAAPSTV